MPEPWENFENNKSHGFAVPYYEPEIELEITPLMEEAMQKEIENEEKELENKEKELESKEKSKEKEEKNNKLGKIALLCFMNIFSLAITIYGITEYVSSHNSDSSPNELFQIFFGLILFIGINLFAIILKKWEQNKQ